MVARSQEADAAQDPEWAKGRQLTSPTAACGDITPGQIASRMQALNLAADAGVHGAAGALASEGLDGLGSTQGLPESIVTAYNERSVKQIQAGIRSGDMESIATTFAWYQGGGVFGDADPLKALEYAIAWNEASIAQTGKPARFVIDTLDAMKARFTPEQVQKAEQAGRQMVTAAKSSKYWSNP
jgi:hypothetical protein